MLGNERDSLNLIIEDQECKELWCMVAGGFRNPFIVRILREYKILNFLTEPRF